MSIKYFFENYGKFMWSCMMLILVILNYFYDFIFHHFMVQVSLLTVYYFICIVGLYSIFKSKKLAGWLIVVNMMCGIFLSFYPLLVLPVLLLFFVLFIEKYNIFFRLMVVYFVIVLTLLSGFGFYFKTLQSVSVYDTMPSQNKNITCVVLFHDAGATGGDLSLNVEKNYFGFISIRKRIAIIESYDLIEWVNQESIRVNQHVYPIN